MMNNDPRELGRRNEPRVIIGRKRFRLRLGNHFVSVEGNTFTSNPKEALLFCSELSARTHWRHIDHTEPFNEDGSFNRPLAKFDLVVEEVEPCG